MKSGKASKIKACAVHNLFGKVRLYINNQVIKTTDFDDGSNTCFVVAGDQVFLGNKYANCQVEGTPVSKYCQMFNGTISQVEINPAPHYSTQVVNNIVAKSDVLSFSTSSQAMPSNYPYATLTGDFNLGAGNEYHFSTTANLTDDSIDSHATIGRQTYVDINSNDKASWILKYIHDGSSTPNYPSSQFKIKLNVWFDSGSISLAPDEVINPYEEHHLAFSLLQNDAVLYLDGVEISRESCPNNSCADFVGGNKITFGAQKASSCDIALSSCHPFNGYLYNPRIWDSGQVDQAFMQWDARYNYKF